MVVSQNSVRSLSKVDGIDSSQQYEVQFQRISADLEQVTLNMKSGQSRDWVKEILDKTDKGGSEYEQAKLRSLLAKFVDIFALADEDLGYTDKITHEIHLTNDDPVTQHYHCIPPNQYREVKNHVWLTNESYKRVMVPMLHQSCWYVK